MIPIPTTEQEVRDCYQTLMDHNGGWAVMAKRFPADVGSIHEMYGFRFCVIAESNKSESEADCRFLGLPPEENAGPYFYRISVD